jgi:hypothetical protein
MMLLSLLRQLHDEGLSEKEKALIQSEVQSLKSEMGL